MIIIIAAVNSVSCQNENYHSTLLREKDINALSKELERHERGVFKKLLRYRLIEMSRILRYQRTNNPMARVARVAI